MTNIQKELNKGFENPLECFLTGYILKNVYRVSGKKIMWQSVFWELQHDYAAQESGIPSNFDFMKDAKKGELLGQLSIYTDKFTKDTKVTLKEEYLVSIGEIKSMEEEFTLLASRLGKHNIKPEKLSAFSRSILRAINMLEPPRTNSRIRKFLRNPQRSVKVYLHKLKKIGYIQKLNYNWELTPLGKLFVAQFLTIKKKKEPEEEVLKPTDLNEGNSFDTSQ